MRKLLLTLAAAAAVLAAGTLANRSDAMTVGTAAGLRAAIEDANPVDRIHCRPGRPHHSYHRPSSRYRAWDGCAAVGPSLLVPPVVIIGPRRGGWCHYRGSGRGRC